MRFHVIRLLAIVVSVALVALAARWARLAWQRLSHRPQQNRLYDRYRPIGTHRIQGHLHGNWARQGERRKFGRPLLVTGQLKGQLDPSGGQAQGQGRGPVRPVDQQVDMPAAAAFTQGATTPAAGESLGQGVCNVLNLTLGPLDLNLLGLRVQLNQVVLNITAIPGGGLLGDLLCGLAGGPVPPIPTGLQQIIDLLTQILGALGG